MTVFASLEKEHWDSIYAGYRQKYKLDPTFYFNGYGVILYGDGEIIIGAKSYIGWNSIIESARGCTVKIGSECMISPYVSMRTASRDLSTFKPRQGNITIGNGVWIGTCAFLNPNVEIGDKAVIGANSVVTRNVPPYVLACGVPAIIKKRIRFEE